MLIAKNQHLSYCTNIHPGESWPEVLESLENYVLPLRHRLAPGMPFGVGLRLSDQASRELQQGNRLQRLRDWLDYHQCYVFTLNGFPYGGFHRKRVKDLVHHPDWTRPERLNYTLRLFDQLAALLPAGMEGGISTSPLSYALWHSGAQAREEVRQKATRQLLAVVDYLYLLEQRGGPYLHLDLEPEPDGMLSTTSEVIDYYEQILLPAAVLYFSGRLSPAEAEVAARRYLNLCFDVCHFAVEFEPIDQALDRLEKWGIRIGKVQISAALSAFIPAEPAGREPLRRQLEWFNESTYLHQVVEQGEGGKRRYPDLPEALAEFDRPGAREWRTHFHVPVFVDQFHHLTSTQAEIRQVLDRQRRAPFTHHLEVETYTWEVLPQELQTDLLSSLEREMRWVLDTYRQFPAPVPAI